VSWAWIGTGTVARRGWLLHGNRAQIYVIETERLVDSRGNIQGISMGFTN
jgi:hypothetical protein